AIVSNGGGPGVLAADWIHQIGLELGTLQEPSVQALAPQLSPLASLTDLINLSEDATPEHYRLAIEAASNERTIDGVLAIYSPRSHIDASDVAHAVVKARQQVSKPVLACVMGDAQVVPARAVLREAKIPN